MTGDFEREAINWNRAKRGLLLSLMKDRFEEHIR